MFVSQSTVVLTVELLFVWPTVLTMVFVWEGLVGVSQVLVALTAVNELARTVVVRRLGVTREHASATLECIAMCWM